MIVKLEELFDYFVDVLFNYDFDCVYFGDVKKVIKWFNSLKENGLLIDMEEEE